MTTATQEKGQENKIGYQISPINMNARRKLDIKAGDTVRVTSKIVEKGKTRLQAFEGLVIAVKHGKEAGGTFTVRKVASGVGVEKVFALYSPLLDKIEIMRRSKTRRAKLYYIREKTAREIRRKIKGINSDLLSTQAFEEEDQKTEEEAAQVKAEEEEKGIKEAGEQERTDESEEARGKSQEEEGDEVSEKESEDEEKNDKEVKEGSTDTEEEKKEEEKKDETEEK